MKPIRVLITREKKSAEGTAKAVRELGHIPIILPLFEVIDTGTDFPKLDFDGIIFTSRNAVEIFVERATNPANFALTAYCVGETTAQLAKECGFQKLVTGTGGGAKLAEKMLSDHELAGKNLAYPTTSDRSFDMAEALAKGRIIVTTIEIYQVQILEPQLVDLQRIIESETPECAFIFSQNSGRHLCNTIARLENKALFRQMSALAISDKAATQVLSYPWRNVYVAKEPSEAAMLKQLQELSLA